MTAAIRFATFAITILAILWGAIPAFAQSAGQPMLRARLPFNGAQQPASPQRAARMELSSSTSSSNSWSSQSWAQSSYYRPTAQQAYGLHSTSLARPSSAFGTAYPPAAWSPAAPLPTGVAVSSTNDDLAWLDEFDQPSYTMAGIRAPANRAKIELTPAVAGVPAAADGLPETATAPAMTAEVLSPAAAQSDTSAIPPEFRVSPSATPTPSNTPSAPNTSAPIPY